MALSEDEYPWLNDALNSDDPGMDAVIEMSLQEFRATDQAGPSTPMASTSKTSSIPSSIPTASKRRDVGPSIDTSREREAELRQQLAVTEADMNDLRVQIRTLKATLESKAEDLRNDTLELERLLQGRRGKGKGKDERPVGINYADDDFDWSPGLKRCMKEVFGIDGFRLCQQGACNANMDGRDIICVMPTGGGKSLTYQLPALLQPGCTLVISPLISLITDQILHLQEANIEAVKMTGGTPKAELKAIEQRLYALADRRVPPGEKEIKLCYVTPEKFVKNKAFQSLLQKLASSNKLARIVIDEAHCVSQLGHDFRPDYAKLFILRQLMPKVPIMALSATCPPKVRDDLLRILGLKQIVDGNAATGIGTVYFSSPLYRKNLHYSVVPKAPTAAKQLEVMAKYILTKYPNDSGIVYCMSRKDSEVVAQGLFKVSEGKIRTGVYHADRGDEEKDNLHRMWQTGAIKVVCATIAFGLGIDKSNVRFVLHHTISKSLDGFYQESGRAGRDGKDSDCILYYLPGDAAGLSSMVAEEREGALKLRDMISFAQSYEECRKLLFSRYFSLSSELSLSSWTTEDSNALSRCGHCDNCTRDPEDIIRLDVTYPMWQIVQVATAIQRQKDQVTFKMLTEAVRGNKPREKARAVVDLAALGGPVKLSKSQIEHLVVHMLVEGYLDERLAQTLYTKVSYLVPGIKAPRLQRHDATSLASAPSGPDSPKLEYTFLLPKKPKRTSTRGALAVVNGDEGEVDEDEAASADSDGGPSVPKKRGRPRKSVATPMSSVSGTLVPPTRMLSDSLAKSRPKRRSRNDPPAGPVCKSFMGDDDYDEDNNSDGDYCGGGGNGGCGDGVVVIDDDDDDDEVEIIETKPIAAKPQSASNNNKKEELQLASLKPITRSAVSLGKRKDRGVERGEGSISANGRFSLIHGIDDDDEGGGSDDETDCGWIFDYRGSEVPPVKKRVVSDSQKGKGVYVLVPSPRK